MDGETLSIYFDVPATDALGREHVEGKLRFIESGVVIHYKIRERTFRRSDEDLMRIEFPYREVEVLRFEGGWFRRRLTLKTRNPETLEAMPGSDLGRIVMRVARKSSREARRIESFVEYKQSVEQEEEARDRWTHLREDGRGD